MWLKFLASGLTLALLAVGSEVAPLGTYTQRERSHWAFVKRAQPGVPEFSLAADKAWAKSPLDAFILERLKKAGLKPAPRADRATLVRRLYFDLTGLPPSPSEVADFLTDKAPDAYQKLV